MLRAIFELCRISNLPTVWTNVLAAYIITRGQHWHWDARLSWLLIGGSLLYSAGMMLNDAADIAWDRTHRPERPIPSGRISQRTVWLMIASGMLGGYAAMVWLGGAHAGLTAALVAAIVGYDVYHKPWAGSVVIMGACRTLLYLAVASAVSKTWWDNPMLVAQALLLGAYIVGLTIAARSESATAKTNTGRTLARVLLACPLLVVVYSLAGAPLATPISELTPLPPSAGFMLSCRPLLIVPFYLALLALALSALKRGGPNIGKAVGLLLAGITIVDALAVATVSLPVALGFVAAAPVLRLWQRWVAAT
jgi:4-hydroxybenzoate polyprenyltransferase